MKAAQLKITNSKVFLLEIIPLGISRMAVRGFNASKFLSSQRLKAIAALLAKIMQRITSINVYPYLKYHGAEFAFDSLIIIPRKKPINAKGIAKMV
jgi:hypothetical protein